jgi:ribonuclease G
MGRNTLVINCDIRETRVALIENGVIAELQIERAAHRGTVGNVVLGRVTRVLPGMQAAFIDVGMERAAFLHVEDLIRPDDFESYLAGARNYDSDERWNKGVGGKRKHGATAGAADDDDDDDDDEASSVVASPVPIAEEPDDDDDDDDEEEDEDDDDDDEYNGEANVVDQYDTDEYDHSDEREFAMNHSMSFHVSEAHAGNGVLSPQE